MVNLQYFLKHVHSYISGRCLWGTLRKSGNPQNKFLPRYSDLFFSFGWWKWWSHWSWFSVFCQAGPFTSASSLSLWMKESKCRSCCLKNTLIFLNICWRWFLYISDIVAECFPLSSSLDLPPVIDRWVRVNLWGHFSWQCHTRIIFFKGRNWGFWHSPEKDFSVTIIFCLFYKSSLVFIVIRGLLIGCNLVSIFTLPSQCPPSLLDQAGLICLT